MAARQYGRPASTPLVAVATADVQVRARLRERDAEGYLVLHKPLEVDAQQASLVTWMESATEEV